MLISSQFKKVFNSQAISVIILTLLPFVYLAAVVEFCRSDVPFGDQWDFVPLLEKSYSGNVTCGELFAQHNEHRLFFPRIVMLALAHQSKWRVSSELAMIQFLSLLTFFMLVYRSCQFLKNSTRNGWIYVLPLISLLFFCLSQWENWIWGWQIQVMLSIFASVCGFSILCMKDLKFSKVLLSLVLGTISFFSFANGFLFFIIGFIMLLASKHENHRKKHVSLILFFLYSSSVFILYVYNYEKPGYHPSIFSCINNPLEFVKYFFKYLGGAIAGPRLALLVGVCGVALLFILLGYISRKKPPMNEIDFWLSLSLYAMGSAVISGIGRAGFGSGQALSPRYASFSILFWIAILVFIFKTIGFLNPVTPVGNGLFALFFLFVILGISSLAARMNVVGTVYSFERKKSLEIARIELFKDSRDPEILKAIYPPGAFGVERRLDVLKKLEVSVFRK